MALLILALSSLFNASSKAFSFLVNSSICLVIFSLFSSISLAFCSALAFWFAILVIRESTSDFLSWHFLASSVSFLLVASVWTLSNSFFESVNLAKISVNFATLSLFSLVLASLRALSAFCKASFTLASSSEWAFLRSSNLFCEACCSAIALAISSSKVLISFVRLVFDLSFLASFNNVLDFSISSFKASRLFSKGSIFIASLVFLVFSFKDSTCLLIFSFNKLTRFSSACFLALVSSKILLASATFNLSSSLSLVNEAFSSFSIKVLASLIFVSKLVIALFNSSKVLAFLASSIALVKASNNCLASSFNLAISSSFCAIFCSILVFASSNFLIALFTLLASSFNPSCSASFL